MGCLSTNSENDPRFKRVTPDLSVLQIPFLAATQDIVVLLPQWILMAGVVAGHLALTFYLDVPGCPK